LDRHPRGQGIGLASETLAVWRVLPGVVDAFEQPVWRVKKLCASRIAGEGIGPLGLSWRPSGHRAQRHRPRPHRAAAARTRARPWLPRACAGLAKQCAPGAASNR